MGYTGLVCKVRISRINAIQAQLLKAVFGPGHSCKEASDRAMYLCAFLWFSTDLVCFQEFSGLIVGFCAFLRFSALFSAFPIEIVRFSVLVCAFLRFFALFYCFAAVMLRFFVLFVLLRGI